MNATTGLLYFSPSGTTKHVCQQIANGFDNRNEIIDLDITSFGNRSTVAGTIDAALGNCNHVVIGAPVYMGKLPLLVKEFLVSLDGKGTSCSAVVVYGNRDYGVALKNMVEILSERNFSVIGAGAFIGRHSYADIVPMAIGRPDTSDDEKADEFGGQLSKTTTPIRIGDIPFTIDKFSKSDSYSSMPPVYSKKRCTQCGKCAKVCPVGILADNGTFRSNDLKKKCIGCTACVTICNDGGRSLPANGIIKLLMGIMMKKAIRYRMEPVTVLGEPANG